MHDDLQVASDIGSGNVSFKPGEIVRSRSAVTAAIKQKPKKTGELKV